MHAVRHPPLHGCVPLSLLSPSCTRLTRPSRPAAVIYFLRFGSSDRLAFKLLVGFLTLSSLGDTINDCSWAWLYTVKAFTDPNVLALFPPQLVVYACMTGLNVLLAQGFFTCVHLSLAVGRAWLTRRPCRWRVLVVSNRKNWVLPGVMLVLQVTACCFAFYLASWVRSHTYMTEFGDAKVRPRRSLARAHGPRD